MAALTVQQVKDYLRIQHTAEDTLLAALVSRATAMVEAFLNRPIYNRSQTVVLRVGGDPMRGGARLLFMPFYPLMTFTSLTAEEGTAIAAEDLFVDLRCGTVEYKSGARFPMGRYTAVATGGLEAYDEFEPLIEPAINSAIMDTVADLYQRRNPAASAEREGGGVGVEYGNSQRSGVADNFREDSLLPRVAYTIAAWRLTGVSA